jgi:hypothetical protein
MSKSRAELSEMVAALDVAVPSLADECPAACDFWQAFAARAEAIQDAAGPDDHGWICSRLDELLERHHLVPPADQI